MIADGDTEFDTDSGPLQPGVCVEVEGVLQDDGGVLAEEISSEDPADCGLPSEDDDGIGEAEIEGLVESLPNGLIGVWTVAGREVEVTESTELESEEGPFEVGACVEAEGVVDQDGVLLAQEIETKSADDCTDDGDGEIEFFGELQQLPADGLLGDWTVDGTLVRVLPDTEIDLDNGPVAVGACLKIEGSPLADGAVRAREIEVLSAAGGCSFKPDYDDDEDSVEFDGVVQESPADGDLGLWLISGRTVLVDETTELDLRGGGPRVGLCVEVEGDFIDGGVVLASSLEADDNGRNCGAGPGEPAEVELRGLIEELPPGNLFGQWRINGIGVTVSGATELEEEAGSFEVGACVEATGRFLASGALQAREVETEEPGDCDGAVDAVGEVEFRGIATDAPDDGPLGVWTIGFQPVEVDELTEIDEDDGRLRLGACVKVEGARQGDGVILAREVEVETSSGSCVFPDGVVNAATFDDGAVSPGEILSIFGLRLGPGDGAGLEVDNGRVRSELRGVRVWFDSSPAPILFARDDQVNVVAPFSLVGKRSVQLQIEWRGAWSKPIELPVTAASPGLLTLTQTGSGQAAALNVDPDSGAVTVNGAAAPTSPGQIVSLFAVGMGSFERAFADGLVVGDDLPEPELPVRVTIGGQQAQVLYAGGAPGLVLGVLQLNVVIPEGVTLGDDVPVTLEIGDFSSPDGVTLAIQ